jgi:uroporphyrinogen decarboxylase
MNEASSGVARKRVATTLTFTHRLSLTQKLSPMLSVFLSLDPVEDARFDELRDFAEKVRNEGRAFVLGGISAGMLEMGLWLRGFENFFCDLHENRSLAEAICDKILELKMRYWEKALSLLGDLVDVVQEGDDYGGQQGLLISPQIWREVFKPRLRQLFSHIKRCAPHVFIFFHSCGSIYEIIPDLIEVGVDILNPVQVAAANMDTKRLKREFGDCLTFWGGGVDTQRVLPRGTTEQVREEVKRRIEDLAPGGGFVFATVHNIQADVPPENILAMWEAVQEFGRYR